MDSIEDSAIEDSEDIPSSAKNQLEKAINKSNQVIQQFPHSKYVDDAYFIIGKSSFYRKEYTRALKSFDVLINEFPLNEFMNEVRIWHAYTQFKLGDTDSSKLKLEEISKKTNQPRDNKYILYTALSDIALDSDSIRLAFNYLDLAIENASQKSKRLAAYNKIIKIAQRENAYQDAIKYLNLLEKQSDSKLVKKRARLKWIEFNKKVKNYDLILQEIDVMLGTAEYESMYLDLELEKAQILIEKGDLNNGRISLLTFIENTSEKKDSKHKKARANSYFILGKSSLFDEFDFASSREYFDKMSIENNRSEYRNEANKYMDMMDSYDNLKESYRKALKGDFDVYSDGFVFENTESDSIKKRNTTTSVNTDDKHYKKPNRKKDYKIDPESVKNDIIIGTPDSLLMLIGEMLIYDFGRIDSAALRYENLVKKFSNSKFSPRAMYALTFFSNDSVKWRKEFMEKYPNPEFLIEKSKRSMSDLFLNSRMNIIDTFFETPEMIRDSLIVFFELEKDPLSLYKSAYISDYLLNDIQNSLSNYKLFLDSFPDHDKYTEAKIRYDEIIQAISDTVKSIKIDTNKLDIVDSLSEIESLNIDEINIDSNFIKQQIK